MVDFIIVIVAGLVSFMIGGIWFSPNVFYTKYSNILNRPQSDIEAMRDSFKPYIAFPLVLVTEIIIAFIIYIASTHISDVLMYKVLAVFTFTIALSSIKTNIFSYNSLKLFLIVEGQKMISIIVMGLIIIYFT